MSTSHKHARKRQLYIALGVFFLVFVAVLIGYLAKLYPVAVVGSNWIPYREWQADLSVAQKLDSAATKTQVFDQFIINKKKVQLVEKLGIDEDNFFQDEWVYYKTGNESQYNKLISDYFSGDERLFESNVVEPEAIDAMLRIKYNSNFSANNDAYNKAINILGKIQMGQSFDDLAKQYSDDKISGQLNGDIGFVNLNQLLPEVKDVIQNSAIGEPQKNLVISRFGYHILFPVETGTKDNVKIWHIKQILIKTTGYDTWINTQLDTIGMHQLMKL